MICDYDRRYGGPFDRGLADSYYRRPRDPHYYQGATYSSKRVVCLPGTLEYEAYMAGYDRNETDRSYKEWD